MFCKGLQFFGFEFESVVIRISEPVARCYSLKGAQNSILHLIHVEVGYNWRKFQLKLIPLLMPLWANDPADGWRGQSCTHECELLWGLNVCPTVILGQGSVKSEYI